MGTVVEPATVTGLAASFLPMPRMALPLFGSKRVGARIRLQLISASREPLPLVEQSCNDALPSCLQKHVTHMVGRGERPVRYVQNH